MKKTLSAFLLGGVLLAASACQDFLDVNTNPNGPQDVSANLYLPPMIHWMATSPQFDGRFTGRYTQEWKLTNGQTVISTWDRMGYDPSSDNGAQQWRDVYWSLGQNLVDMTNKARAEERWDLLGVAYVLKAWGWQVLVDLHGPIIVAEAIDQSKFSFNYDTEEYAYNEVKMLLDSAIVLLQRTDGAVDATYLSKGDRMYNGDRTKWLRFAYGLLAIHLNHYSNRAGYDPAAVIAAVNNSFASNADDALHSYPGTNNDDMNFWGRTRNNLTNYRQTRFAVSLFDGTTTGGTVDPRMSRMLSPSPDGLYRGVSIDSAGYGSLTAPQQPNNFYGFVGTGGTGVPGRFLFDDRAKIPVITYAQLQFIKAEAAHRSGDFPTALAAYTAGISSHIDFVNARNLDNAQSPTQISAAEKATFLGSPNIVPAVAANLTLTQIMTQKYIAQYGWGHNELWMDLRRFHYTDIDPQTGAQVYPGFALPLNLYADNGGLPVYRIRPRFNSEYVWNVPAVEAIGGLEPDYHTERLWIIEP